MKNITIRASLTIWYAFTIMLFLTAAFILTYLLLENALLQQDIDTIAQDAAIIAEEAESEDGRVVLDLDDDEAELLTQDIHYVFYLPNPCGLNPQRLDGRQTEWIDRIEVVYDEARRHIYNGQYWLVYDKPAYDDSIFIGWVRVLMPLDSIQSALEYLLLAGIIGAPICFLLSILGGFFIARRALKPISDIIQTAEQMGEGNLSIRLPHTGTNDEVGKLKIAFNEMANNLDATFLREKRFTSDASHEMRTPLTVIISYAEDALKRKDINIYTDAMTVILDKSRQMQTMISQMLALAREHEQEQTLCMESIDLTAVIEDIAEEMRNQAFAKGIQIETELTPNITIDADMLTFTRMLMNLLDNSIKYGKEGGTVHIATEKQGNNVLITVRDNGYGIAKEDKNHIFERFYRGDKSRTGNTGTGLGLTFVQMIVKLHKGSIRVESSEGVGTSSSGTCFKILLPMKQSS